MGDGCRKVRNTLMGTSVLLAAVLVLGETGASASSGTVLKEPQYGFSFQLPANWKQVPLDGSDVTALLNSASHDDPTLANALSSEVTSGAAKGMKVFAIGPLAGSTVPNVNVIVTSSAGAPTGPPLLRPRLQKQRSISLKLCEPPQDIDGQQSSRVCRRGHVPTEPKVLDRVR